VDNEKEQILDKLNINTHTFRAIKILNQLGFTKETPLLMAQDILFDYVKEIERLSSTIGSYVPNKKEQAMDNVLKMKKYQISDDEYKIVLDQSERDILTPKNLEGWIKEGPKANNYRLAQAIILDLFTELDQLGLDLQTLQSTINLDSKGLGKSILETQLKEEQVMKLILGETPIQNAVKTIGDVQRILRSKTKEYEAKGYRVFPFGDTAHAYKPETINGFAISYGLFTSNDLWSRMFPYRNSGVSGMFEWADMLMGGDATQSQTGKAEMRRDIWLGMKSFRYADRNLGLYEYTSSATEERLRLIYDRWEQKEVVDGEQIITEQVKTKDSLAAYLRMVQQTDLGKKNTFLASLETLVQKNGDPSTVRYRASVSEQSNEVHLYIAILQLLKENKTIVGENGEPILFNGETYTQRQLMQDLILYSYMTGGIQEAIQFVKYIPAAYLKSIPFADELGNTEWNRVELGIPDHPSRGGTPLDYLYNVPPFMQQYIQHNPEKVPSVNEKDIATFDKQSLKESSIITLTKKGVEKIGFFIPSDTRDYQEAPFVTIRTGISSSKFKLFKFKVKTGEYIQIDTLGAHGISEYNSDEDSLFGFTEGLHTTLIKRNESPIDPLARPVTIDPLTVRQEPESIKKIETPETEAKVSTFVDDILEKNFNKSEQGHDAAKNILNQIVLDSDTPYYTALADELVKHVDQLPPDIKFVVSGLNKLAAGSYIYGEQKVTVFPSAIGRDLKANLNKENVNRIILHEMLHGLTGYKVMYYEQILNNRPNKAKAEAIIAKLPNWKWTKKDEAAVKSIRVLMNQVKTAI
ncbi:hypothetical protein LCGC14_1910240, partial [marine sediment metagenome]